jgi:hypothetical protein
VLEVPGISAGAVEARLGIRVETELRARAAAHDDEAGSLAARDIRAVVVGDEVLEQAAPERRRLAVLEEAEILDKKGTPLSGPLASP